MLLSAFCKRSGENFYCSDMRLLSRTLVLDTLDEAHDAIAIQEISFFIFSLPLLDTFIVSQNDTLWQGVSAKTLIFGAKAGLFCCQGAKNRVESSQRYCQKAFCMIEWIYNSECGIRNSRLHESRAFNP